MHLTKIKALACLAFACLLSGPVAAAEQPKPATSLDEHFTLTRLNGTTLDAYLKRPVHEGKFPLIILMQGSGCDSLVDPFLGLTESYGDRYARLVVEKVGVKRGDDGQHCTQDYLTYNTVDLRIFDYLQVLSHLRAAASWWDGKLYIIGASEGGLTAGILAAFAPETQRVAILSYGGGVTMAEARPDAIYGEVIQEGRTPAQAAASKAEAIKVYPDIRANPVAGRDFDGDTNTYKWWASILDLRLANVLPDITAPIYLVQGSKDEEMPVDSSRKAAKLLAAQGRKDFEYCEYPGLSHEYNTSDGKSELAGVFLDAIDWLTDAPKQVRRVPVQCTGPLAQAH
jgi:dienelactone hydrolase